MNSSSVRIVRTSRAKVDGLKWRKWTVVEVGGPSKLDSLKESGRWKSTMKVHGERARSSLIFFNFPYTFEDLPLSYLFENSRTL